MDLSHYSFVSDGFASMGNIFTQRDCSQLLSDALRSRDFNEIFLTEDEFRSNPSISGNNPRPGRNLLSKLETEFIFSNSLFQETMTRVLGPRWRILDYKFVVGLDNGSLPEWLSAELNDRPIANLGPYVKEHFRDLTYFRGIDFHQDILDFPDRDADFVTVYIYLDDVDVQAAPLYVIPGSHQFGATVFPHNLVKNPNGSYTYTDDVGMTANLECLCLTGCAGSMYYWHSATLHGTQPTFGDQRRISVRILVEKNSRAPMSCELDLLNASIRGPLSLGVTRKDLDDQGNLLVRQNIINLTEK